MKFEQTRDLIDHVVAFHSMLSSHFIEVSEKTADQRLKLFLDYLVEHERAQACRLSEYAQEAPNKVLGMWFQFSNCEERFRELKNTLKSQESTVSEVVDLIVNLYDCLIGQFQEFSESAESEEVRAVCGNIASLEKKDKLKIVRNSRMLEDL
jgi:hypothetical protein